MATSSTTGLWQGATDSGGEHGTQHAGDELSPAPTSSDVPVSVDVPPAPAPAVPVTITDPTPPDRAEVEVWTTPHFANAPRIRRAGPLSRRPWVPLVSSSLTLLAVLLLVFVAQVTLLSAVEHTRSQRVAYAEFRNDLSALTAPTGQTDINGQLLALGTPVAYMTVPGLGLEREVVFEGTTSGVLVKGPGHRRSTALPGQPGVSILYGRAWSHGGPFGGAEDLLAGSEIRVTTGQGEHTYQVTGIRRKGDPIPRPPETGKGRLTLVTATGSPYVPQGLVYVDAELTSPAVEAAPRPLKSSDLRPAEEALAGEPAALPAAFLLLQGLALTALGVAWASRRWGPAQAWLVGFPLTGLFAVLASREILRLLPNLL